MAVVVAVKTLSIKVYVPTAVFVVVVVSTELLDDIYILVLPKPAGNFIRINANVKFTNWLKLFII
jgi:hypothetical protein